MRGLPGSGKSTKAASYGGTIVSADDFFTHDGEYHYNQFRTGEAHERCRMDFLIALSRGDSPVVVDNTNIIKKEYEPYVQMAEDAGYDVIIDTVQTDLTPQDLAERNTHGVPVDVIEKMFVRWEE